MPELTPVKNAAQYLRIKAFEKFGCYHFVNYLMSSSHRLVKQCQTRQTHAFIEKNQHKAYILL